MNLPRQPRLLLERPASADAQAAPWLFAGAMDPALERDLTRLPLTAASQERVVPTRRMRVGRDLVLAPQAALRAGTSYTLALPLSALSDAQAQLNQHKPWSAALQVDASSQAGAAVRGSFPLAGAARVTPRLSWLALSFDGDVFGSADGIWLEDDAGYAVSGISESAACDALDSAAVSCIRWRPDAALGSEVSYNLRTGQALRDAHGAQLDELQIAFTTAADGEVTEPPWQRAPCAIDEQTLAEGCARVLDDRIALRLFSSPSTRVQVALATRRWTALPQREGVVIELDGLTPDSDQALIISAFDLEARERRSERVLRTAAALPTLAISEVYADPAGREPDQEFVELWNYGARAQPLSGLFLGDASAQGQAIESDASLAPDARALLVSDTFSTDSALDAPPRAGTLLVRMGKALTPSGLSNRGEALFLRDAAGHRLSRAPDHPAPQPGQCLQRVGADPHDDDPESFRGAQTCTPGS